MTRQICPYCGIYPVGNHYLQKTCGDKECRRKHYNYSSKMWVLEKKKDSQWKEKYIAYHKNYNEKRKLKKKELKEVV